MPVTGVQTCALPISVVESRKLPEADVRAIADGRVLTGEEAKERGLVDALGNFYDAVDLVKTEANLSGEPHLVYPPNLRDWPPLASFRDWLRDEIDASLKELHPPAKTRKSKKAA